MFPLKVAPYLILFRNVKFLLLRAHTLVLIIGMIPFSTNCTSAPDKPKHLIQGDYSAVTEYIHALAKKEMGDHDVVGMSVALVDDQQIVWSEGFGYADKANNIRATPDTLYRVGSITKLFTASAVMQLAEQETLDIDQPLRAYLPEFQVKTRYPSNTAITSRNVMSHHSGLPRDYLEGMWGENLKPFNGILQRIRNEYAAYPPNLLFSYSNVGLTLLGSVVEAVSGVPYAEYINRGLLQPLRMIQSVISSAPPPMTKGYRKGEEARDPLLRDTPAGGLNSSVSDMSRFLSMVFAKGKVGETQVLQSKTVAEMLRPQNTGNPLDRNFHVGLGWMLSSLDANPIERAGTVAHHGGATMLFHTQLIALPEQKLGVVVLANSDSAGKVVNTIAAETLKLALEAKSGIQQPQRQSVSASDTPLDPEVAQNYAGSYTTVAGPVMITADGSRLTAQIMGETMKLFPRTDGQLGVKFLLFGFIPISVEELENLGLSLKTVAGRHVLIARIGTQEMLIGEKIKPITLSKAWINRLGEYELINRGQDYEFVQSVTAAYEHGVAFVEITTTAEPDTPFRIAVQPVSESEAIILGSLAGMGETIKIVQSKDGSEVLEFSGYRFRKVL